MIWVECELYVCDAGSSGLTWIKSRKHVVAAAAAVAH